MKVKVYETKMYCQCGSKLLTITENVECFNTKCEHYGKKFGTPLREIELQEIDMQYPQEK